VIFGVDVSAYQPNFDFSACAREGFDFAFIKSTEGTGWRSPNYHAQVQRARNANLLVAAYHYVNGADVDGQLANIRAMVSTDTPVILDVEANAGPISSIRALNSALNEAGYRTPFIYIPRWYWQGHMGSPSLAGLPPNWHSRYPDNTVRRKDGFSLGAEYWPSFGGLDTVIAQFTSSLAVANFPNGRIDGNAYRGTREELAAWMGGGNEDDVALTDNQKIALDSLVPGESGVRAAGPTFELLVGLKGSIDALADKLDGVATGTGYSLKQIAQAVVAEFKEAGN
jgi:lysozyme